MRGVMFQTGAGRNSLTTPPDPDAIVAAVAARQHGGVTTEQLLAAGLDRYAIRRRVQAGRLHRLYKGVYAVGHVGLSFEGKCMAAVLASGPNAAASHLTAAELRRVSRWRVGIIAIVTATQHSPPDIDVHHVRRLDRLDVTRVNGIPTTTVARTLVDLSDTLTPYQLAYVIHEAAFRGPVRPRRHAPGDPAGERAAPSRPTRAGDRAAPRRLPRHAQR